jgi:hypothetical protein
MANHRQSIEDPRLMLARMTQVVITAAGAVCALWLLLRFREATNVAWFFIVLAALLSIGATLWGGQVLKERLGMHESYKGFRCSPEFVSQMRVFNISETEWPSDDEDQVVGALVAGGTGRHAASDLLHPAPL